MKHEKIPIWSSDRRAVWLISINKGRRFQSGTNLRWIHAGALSILVILSWEKNSSILCESLCTMGFGDVELRTLCSDFLVTSWPSRTHSDLCTGSSKGAQGTSCQWPNFKEADIVFSKTCKMPLFFAWLIPILSWYEDSGDHSFKARNKKGKKLGKFFSLFMSHPNIWSNPSRSCLNKGLPELTVFELCCVGIRSAPHPVQARVPEKVDGWVGIFLSS